jgi:TldD protein
MTVSDQLALPEAPFAPGGELAIDGAIAQRLLATALEGGGDYADLYFEYRNAAEYNLEEERIKAVSCLVAVGLGVRVIKGDATGYAYSEDLTLDRMLHAARMAGQIAAGGGAPAPIAASPVALRDYYPVPRPTLVAPPQDKLAVIRAADRAARSYDPRIVTVDAWLLEQVREVMVVASDGRWTKDVQPIVMFGVTAVAEQAQKRQSGKSGGGGRHGMEYFAQPSGDPAWHGREAARIALTMLDAREAPAGELEVVLAPGHAGILLHEAVGHGLEADFNRKRTSSYAGRIGEVVASPLCSVVDDATLPHARGAINVDDEGHAGRANVLIQNGVLVGYMHDRLSARHFGVEPSGNGRRESFCHPPLPRMTNTALLAGPHEPEEIIRSVRKGVFARRFSGGQVNIANGDFVFSPTESYLIEDGKLTAPVKGVSLIGNGPEVLRRVTMLGNDFALSDGIWSCVKDGQYLPVGVGTPTIKISSITVGGTQTRRRDP